MKIAELPEFSPSAVVRFNFRPIVSAIQTSLMGLSLACASAQGAEILVTSNLDDNGEGCTLREAIESANTVNDLQNGCSSGSDDAEDRIIFDPTAFGEVAICFRRFLR